MRRKAARAVHARKAWRWEVLPRLRVLRSTCRAGVEVIRGMSEAIGRGKGLVGRFEGAAMGLHTLRLMLRLRKLREQVDPDVEVQG